MHELLLFGQVPAVEHDLVLKVLAGIAAMQPQPLAERHLIFMPTKSPTANTQVGAKQGVQGSQAQALKSQMHGDVFYLQLVGTLDNDQDGSNQKPKPVNEDTVMSEDFIEGTNDTKGASFENEAKARQQDKAIPRQEWSLEFRDLPEVPGRRPVASRLMASIPITDGDAVRFVEELGYIFVCEYVLHGHQFIHNNIILLLHRPLLVPSLSGPNSSGTATRKPFAPAQFPSLSSLRPVDPSNTYILQASIRVQDGTKPETMTIGMNELKTFKDMMKGVVDMEVGDRLALDTRVK